MSEKQEKDPFAVDWNTTATVNTADDKTPTLDANCEQNVVGEALPTDKYLTLDAKTHKDIVSEFLTKVRLEKVSLQKYADTEKFWEMLASFEALEKDVMDYLKYLELKEVK